MGATDFFNHLVKTLAFPFKGREWGKKLAIGYLLTMAYFIVPLVPILFVTGYCRKIMKAIILENAEPALPDWEDWGRLIGDGFKLWGAGFIYGLPTFLLTLASLAGYMLPAAVILMQGIQGSSLTMNVFPLLLAGVGLGYAISCLSIPVGVVTSLFQLPATGHVAATGQFSAAFRFREWWNILKAGFTYYIIVIAALMGIGFIGFFFIQIFNLPLIGCLLYPLALGFYMLLSLLYSDTFAALAYRAAKQQLAG